ncbi:hypothetical protein [Thiobacillus sp.]
MTPEEIENQKRVEYYAASVNAWFNTSLEHDKNLLALSAGGIGLLLTLLTTVGLSSAESLILYIGAIASFVVALVAILIIFRRNRTYIENTLSGKSSNDPFLTKLDLTALWAFGIGVVFTAIIGIAAAVHSYSTKEKTMANETTKKTETVALSFNGASSLQSSTDFTKSFNGAANLQPQPVASTTAPAASSSAPATPATPASSSTSQTQSGNDR